MEFLHNLKQLSVDNYVTITIKKSECLNRIYIYKLMANVKSFDALSASVTII